VDYEHAVEAAPPGWRHFTIADIDRLPASARTHEMERVPLEERAALVGGDASASERVLRAFFWTLVYNLEPAMWDALSEAEPIHPELLAALPASPGRILEVGAGSGRLTGHLAARGASLLAVEPVPGLAALLRARLPQVHVVAAWAEALPVHDGWSQMTTACGLGATEPALLEELERVTAPGGDIVLISPESPQSFESLGWRRLTLERLAPPPHRSWIDDFFGNPDPPHELVSKHIR
jgi:SAM-dependent methyltransferase